MPTLGEELKRLREESGLTVRDVADGTHIGGRFLQAIESDNYSILPGGIFNRGFVRSYARFIGMDEEQALVLYNQQLEAQGGETPRSAAPSFDGIDEEASSPWGSIALIVIILLLLSAGIYTAYRWFFKGTSVAQEIVGTAPSPTASLLSDTNASASPTASGSAAALDATPGPAGSPTPSISPAAPLSGNLQVKLQIGTNPCWLKVISDANPPVESTLNPGDVREFSAADKMILSLGNAVGVNATLNGRPMKLPLTKGVASYVVLRKDNYQNFLQ